MIRRALVAASTVLGILVPVAVATAPVASAGGTCHAGATAGRGDHVGLTRLCFEPSTLFVDPGARVTFTNDDEISHNVTGHGFEWGSTGDLVQGGSTAASFPEPGVYAYSCTLHPGMVGAIVVGDPTAALLRTGAAPAPIRVSPSTSAPPGTAAGATALAAGARPVAAAGDDGLGTSGAVFLALGAGLAGAAVALAGLRLARRRPAE
jgi:plastocyanin